MDVRLILDSGTQKGRETKLARGVYLVGRSRNCQIRPKNKSVSRNHCAIIHRKRELLLQDTGSKHGTFLNDKRIENGLAVVVSDGDRLRVGGSHFRFAIDTGKPKAKKSGTAHDRSQPDVDQPKLDVAESDSSESHSDSDIGFRDESASGSDAAPEPVVASNPKADAAVSPGDSDANVIDDILSLLEDVENSDVSPASAIKLPTQLDSDHHQRDHQGNQQAASVLVDVDGLEEVDEGVDFAAPRSSESLGDDQPLPAYKLRHDWDIQSVQKWVGQKQATAPVVKPPQRKFKLKDPKRAKQQVAEEKELDERKRKLMGEPEVAGAAWADWLESDSIKPIALIGGILLFIAIMAYNIWSLWSFDG